MKKKNGFTLVELMIVMLILLGVVPYVMNVAKLIGSDFKAPYKKEIVHSIGVVTPLYLVTGFLNIEDGEIN
jgi:prepilin-type N-terminal cleavage/methylation domain-containing protein